MRYLPARVRNADDASAAPTVLDARDHRRGERLARRRRRGALRCGRREAGRRDRKALSRIDRARLPLGRRGSGRDPRSRGAPRRGAAHRPHGSARVARVPLPGARRAAASVCQATWIRQGDVEVVFVAPLPADGAWMVDADMAVRAAGGGAAVKRSIARDLRLIQASAGEAPPRDARHAIDRIFMLPLRRALDRAPRASRSVVPPSRPMPERRP